jgi:hypothetical protein
LVISVGLDSLVLAALVLARQANNVFAPRHAVATSRVIIQIKTSY